MSSLSGVSSGAASSLLNGLSQPALSINGLVTGLDTEKIITGLLAIEQQKINFMETKQKIAKTQEDAFKEVQLKLLNLQADIFQLGKSQNGPFDGRAVTSSNQDILTGAASSSASPGVYSMQVSGLARSQAIASQGYDSAISLITQGTFQLRMGNGSTANITIDSSNNTLQGLANAINSSAVGVTATIVNDGSGYQGYRLLLTANKSGASNTIAITNNLAASSGAVSRPVFDSTYLGNVSLGSNYTGTSTPQSNSGTGTYTGTANSNYTFTVVSGGTVGQTDGIQVSYTDSTGANTGTITVNSGDTGVFKSVAQGIQVQFGAGTLVAGQTFSIKAYAPQVQSAANAAVTLGSGAGALTVQSPTNRIDGVINGVTLKLNSADPAKTVSLTVAGDVDTAQKAISTFVTDYNDLQKYINALVSYNPDTKAAGVLLGNRQITTIQDQLTSLVTTVVGNANPRMNRLSALGITLGDNSQLTVDDAKLTSALNGQLSGVTLGDVRNLFAMTGSSSNPGVEFVVGSGKTQESVDPYQVNVLQAAQQGSIAATNTLAASTVIDGTNNAFTISINGTTSSTITLAAGTYTAQALAQEVQSEINASSSLSGRLVTAGIVGGKLTITSNTYGSSSKVKIGSGTALGVLGFAGTEAGSGSDVVGNFVANGVTETATGSGQFLQGDSTNANTSGLQVRVALTPSQLGNNPVATLTVKRGIASKLDLILQGMLDPVTGRLQTITSGFDSQIQDIQKQIDRQTVSMQAQHDALVAQFAALESTVSKLQSAGSFLSNQLTTQTRGR